jgi:Spy/CpxP family protein refolding chaperone
MRLVAAALLILVASTAVAQHHHGQAPYAGMHQRAIKALSEQQISDLRAGRGMGLALAAELNGYPGPLHVLELADRLQLSGDQAQRVQSLYTAMKGEAVAAGEKLIAAEQELDRQFAEKEITPSRLVSLTSQIGERQGDLRAIHLKYHLTTADVLTPDQRQRYRELRGYR